MMGAMRRMIEMDFSLIPLAISGLTTVSYGHVSERRRDNYLCTYKLTKPRSLRARR